jgi:TolA-binding protein
MRLRFSRTGLARPLAIISIVAAAGTTWSQQKPPTSATAGDFGQLYAQAMTEFQAGEYAKAAEHLDALLTKAEFNPQLEPAFFTLGSAWFNAGDYKKAIAAFKNYQTKFPSGPHVADVTYGLAQSNLLSKNYSEAAAQFGALEKDPHYRDQALYYAARTSKDAGQIDQAVAILEKLVSGELKSSSAVHGAILLAQLYAQKGQADKTIALIKKIHGQITLVDNLVELNGLTVQLGDQLYEKKLFEGALECYRAAFPREQLIQMQNGRLIRMQQRIDENLAIARRDPSQFGQIATAINQLKIDAARTRKLLEDFEKLPTITPGIYMRMARSFYETDHKWESVVVYQELIDRFPKIPERESVLFGLIVSLADVNQPKKAQALCDQYLREFKAGPNAETVGYMMGALALQANDAQTAESHFVQMLEAQAKSNFRDQMRYLLGNAKFMQGKYDEAIAEYKKYLTEFPNGQSIEDVNFRLALTALFAGKYQDAMNELNGYLKKYPQGHYRADAKYRLAVCKYAASLYNEVVTDCEAWEKEFGNHQQLGEVLALRADALAATDHSTEATDTYIRSYKSATTDEVMNYSLFAASKILQKLGEWDKVAELFQGFIENKPDSPTFLSALYWVGKAKAHEGKLDEAKQITAQAIKQHIADLRREKVELLLTQLAQLCVKKQKRGLDREKPLSTTVPSDAQSTNSTPLPEEEATKPVESAADHKSPLPIEASPIPTQSLSPSSIPIDPGAEMDALLGSAEKDQSATARARVFFAKAEVERLRRQPVEEEKNIAHLAGEFKPEDLSPLLLGRAGDYLLNKQKADDAARFYQRLMDEFPKSEYLDFAYRGLGEIAFQKKDFPEALHYFSDGTERIAPGQKLKDLTVGKAKTFLAMDKLDEAKKAFEQVASVREWRGEATAFSVYSLGDIEARKGRWVEANAYFQRVYVAYRKFLPWVAKAYIRSGESFEKLGKPQEAANTYRELLRNEKLTDSAEAAEAKKRLEALGQQG